MVLPPPRLGLSGGVSKRACSERPSGCCCRTGMATQPCRHEACIRISGAGTPPSSRSVCSTFRRRAPPSSCSVCSARSGPTAGSRKSPSILRCLTTPTFPVRRCGALLRSPAIRRSTPRESFSRRYTPWRQPRSCRDWARRGLRFAERAYSCLVDQSAYIRGRRTIDGGLAALVHPWETGLDNSPGVGSPTGGGAGRSHTLRDVYAAGCRPRRRRRAADG